MAELPREPCLASRGHGVQPLDSHSGSEPQQLRLMIRGDGKGIDAERIQRQQPKGHFGLPGMRERAAVVKGTTRRSRRA